MKSTKRLPQPNVREPDLVDRIFEYLADEPALRALSSAQLRSLQESVRSEFAGDRCYIKGRPATARQELVSSVLALFNGRNTREVARRLQVSRHTVLRVLKQSGEASRLTIAGRETPPPLASKSPCPSQTPILPPSTPLSRAES